MNLDRLAEFGLDPDVVHLNHGAFGCAPIVVRDAVTARQHRAELNPHRYDRVELPGLIASARASAAGFLGLDPDACGLVRNVSEGISAVLGSLDLVEGDEVVLNNHGYGAVLIAAQHWAARRGVRVVTASFPVGASQDVVVAAYADAVCDRTRLVIVDQITSPTATVLPVAPVAAAVEAPVLVDAAHVPGTLPTDVAALGASYWVGNLHKWAYTPRGSAVLWSADGVRERTRPSVLSWQLELGYGPSFDYPGTWDYSGWLSIPDGLAYWQGLGGWDQIGRLADLVEQGQRLLAERLGTSLLGMPAVPAPTMRLVRLPAGMVTSMADVDSVYERLSVEHRIETAPVLFEGEGFVRVAAAPYTTIEDYAALATALCDGSPGVS